MPSALNPYINFRGTAREAARFYHSVFGGDLLVTTFGDAGITEWPDQVDNVMHSRLTSASGFVLMCSDVPETMEITFGDNICVSLVGDDTDELTGWYDALSEGGTVTIPLSKADWGDSFGMLTDRFGVRWLANIELPPAPVV